LKHRRSKYPQDRFVGCNDPMKADQLVRELAKAIARQLAREDHEAEREAKGR
jgi:hypothetical protein